MFQRYYTSPSMEYLRLHNIVIMTLVFAFSIFLLISCKYGAQQRSLGVQIYITHGLDAGKQAVTFKGDMPRGWPTDFTPPSNTLAPIQDKESNLRNLVVKSDPESVSSYCQNECERLGFAVTRIESPIGNGSSSKVLQINTPNGIMFITVLPAGFGLRTIPEAEAVNYVIVRFNSRVAP
jgi:hypothetical protein